MHKWDDNLYLFTPEELERIPDGTVLSSISGGKYVKGKDIISVDTRYGFTAFGILDPWNHPLKDLFLVFKLKE